MAVYFCRDAGIDDPVSWFNACEPRVIDLWVALAIYEATDANKMQPAGQVMQGVARKQGLTDGRQRGPDNQSQGGHDASQA
ncbi:unnamed protein product [marine sediment metagenome]|uniref:Uncharacterized protein n=1 Tax=marine sediment metagenome TaxID=412755 RepID=X0W3V8_9ZZZZ